MEYDYEERTNSSLRSALVSLGYIAATVLLSVHLYSYFWGPSQETFQGDFNFALMQLTRGLAEVNRKHERLQNEMERISTALPAAVAAAGRAKDALEPSLLRRSNRQAIDVHDYDRQVVDYALESAGGRILDTGDTIEHMMYESPMGWAIHVLMSWFCRDCNGARAMIHPNTLPGECWAFKGSQAEAIIRLLGTVIVTGISVEHIPANISPTKDIQSAPRLIQVEGLEYRTDSYPHGFGTFEYDKEGKSIQYFAVTHPAARGYNMVRVRVLSNWGDPVYTCVYRVRVHGELAPGQAEYINSDHSNLHT